MEKISTELLAEAAREPAKSFNILIVLEDEKDADNLPIKEFKTYMGNIVAAMVSGSEITSLSKMESIKSIEMDGEVTAW